jgi:hypothetical protein
MLPATDARVFKIAGGNELLPQALLDAARVHLKLGWTVNEVLNSHDVEEPRNAIVLWRAPGGQLHTFSLL